MDVQWYPGQMAKAKRLLRENLKLVDAVIEVLDARIPHSSKNPDIRDLLARRPVVGVLTRLDLADPSATAEWVKKLHSDYFAVTAVNANSGDGVKKLLQLLKGLPQRRKHGQRPIRLIVVGIPNVGKSSLINRLTKRSAAATGDKPGITKGKQWVRVNEGLEILDTPGMLWPKITSERQAFGLATAGAVKDEILDPVQMGVELVGFMQNEYAQRFAERYKLEQAEGDPRHILNEIGRRRGCLVKGGEVDLEAAARLVVKDFREGRLGRITLEKAGESYDEDEVLPDDHR
ncbi:ribosome biogenesis GTPase YlqF [Dethiobacter alkaliphilus]|uniref:Ribosome biogenesis GTPase A n=1 Tax=Dethiobacter alkaliphilus AHT 1 TaxID=555088 RepID=C0GHM3_DETAL|nr:ribosome biogenesis GTPase YlqF [Dethiobacter alkaliphilus]EEG77229.1 GTP-binding protein HSR1-related [Dethiobacter alkaliphilus AHT 1]